MTLTQLKYLVAIVDQGFNITRAAAVLHTSQPGISRQIRLMEEQLGISMLIRVGGRITGLTQEGIRVAISAKRIVKEVSSLMRMGEEFMQQETGRLSVATVHSLALSMLPSAVMGLRTRYPGVTIAVQHASASQCFDLLRTGDLDLGITIEAPGLSSGLIALPLQTVPRVLIVPPDHELLSGGLIGLADIARYPLIFQGAMVNSGWAVSRVFKASGIELQPVIEAMDASVIKAYVEHGAGIAIISGAAFDPQRDRGLRSIDVSHLFEPSYIFGIFDPLRFMRGYAYEFIELLAPAWSKLKVDEAIRDIVYGADLAGH
jgi:LysR family cys regulon transcriptional activator